MEQIRNALSAETRKSDPIPQVLVLQSAQANRILDGAVEDGVGLGRILVDLGVDVERAEAAGSALSVVSEALSNLDKMGQGFFADGPPDEELLASFQQPIEDLASALEVAFGGSPWSDVAPLNRASFEIPDSLIDRGRRLIQADVPRQIVLVTTLIDYVGRAMTHKSAVVAILRTIGACLKWVVTG